MSANRIFIVCQHCQEPSQAMLLAERADGESQYIAVRLKQADNWYAKHQRCGTGVDHFKLAYQRTQDHDVMKPAAVGVAAALINGSGK